MQLLYKIQRLYLTRVDGSLGFGRGAVAGSAFFRPLFEKYGQHAPTPQRSAVKIADFDGNEGLPILSWFGDLRPDKGGPLSTYRRRTVHLINAEKRQRRQRRYQYRILCQNDAAPPCTTFISRQCGGVK
jgi:hypothetical protein